MFYFFLSVDVFPQQIEGIKMIVNKTLSSFFKVFFLSHHHVQNVFHKCVELFYFKMCCFFCLQISHMLHLSAVSPSYYRFHVEHLQSDDYSKDKV